MVQKSYLYFLKERFLLLILAASTWTIVYCLTCSYGLRNPTICTIPGALFLVVGGIVFVFGGAGYRFLTQEKYS